MTSHPAANSTFVALLAITTLTAAASTPATKSEDAGAAAQYRQLNVSKDPATAAAGTYKLDPHHTSVIAKLAHMDLSRYTLRFDDVSGSFDFNPSTASASNVDIAINPRSVDTGDPAFDKRIASKYFEADKYPTMTFTADAVKITGDHASLIGTLDFHGVKKAVVLNTTYRGFTQSRMGFSGEAHFKRSDFGVSEWVPLEADDVTILVETEFVKQ
ncbi:polyisoprenoid-binding protein [Rhodanobacter sp. 7MK24]|uniref:YceI family protein n=1 Tax=Rhodanobacter sp. 7MK24 TaxID=2775922 RepID=UPI00177F707E|nr:YceI family protein [Rhodanobacter sp. 7MK24]MBD8880776.1 polyisoprenoid-binding protein [Rhodanobacter sp. 7MK24]